MKKEIPNIDAWLIVGATGDYTFGSHAGCKSGAINHSASGGLKPVKFPGNDRRTKTFKLAQIKGEY